MQARYGLIANKRYLYFSMLPSEQSSQTGKELLQRIIKGVIMSKLRYSKEEFGYLVVFPDGSIELYNPEVEAKLACASTKNELEQYLLKQFTANSSFHLNSPLIVWFEV